MHGLVSSFFFKYDLKKLLDRFTRQVSGVGNDFLYRYYIFFINIYHNTVITFITGNLPVFNGLVMQKRIIFLGSCHAMMTTI